MVPDDVIFMVASAFVIFGTFLFMALLFFLMCPQSVLTVEMVKQVSAVYDLLLIVYDLLLILCADWGVNRASARAPGACLCVVTHQHAMLRNRTVL